MINDQVSIENMTLEDATFTAARVAVDQILLATVGAIAAPSSAPEFEPAVMALFATLIQVEDLLASTSIAYPHRERECFEMFSEVALCKETAELLLAKNGITPFVIDL